MLQPKVRCAFDLVIPGLKFFSLSELVEAFTLPILQSVEKFWNISCISSELLVRQFRFSSGKNIVFVAINIFDY